MTKFPITYSSTSSYAHLMIEQLLWNHINFLFLNPKALSFNNENRVNEKLLTYVQWKYTALTWSLHLCKQKQIKMYLFRYWEIKSFLTILVLYHYIKYWLLCKNFYCNLFVTIVDMYRCICVYMCMYMCLCVCPLLKAMTYFFVVANCIC